MCFFVRNTKICWCMITAAPRRLHTTIHNEIKYQMKPIRACMHCSESQIAVESWMNGWFSKIDCAIISHSPFQIVLLLRAPQPPLGCIGLSWAWANGSDGSRTNLWLCIEYRSCGAMLWFNLNKVFLCARCANWFVVLNGWMWVWMWIFAFGFLGVRMSYECVRVRVNGMPSHASAGLMDVCVCEIGARFNILKMHLLFI